MRMIFALPAIAFVLICLVSCSQEDTASTAPSNDSSPSNTESPSGSLRLFGSCTDSSVDREESTTATATKIRGCLTGHRFHFDGPQLRQFISDYTCSSREDRGVFAAEPIYPEITQGLYKIASNNLADPNLSESDREYVQPTVESYRGMQGRGTAMMNELLSASVSSLEFVRDQSRWSLAIELLKTEDVVSPAQCAESWNDRHSAIVLLTEEAMQRYAHLWFLRLTDTIARGNKTDDIEAAGLNVADFMLDSRTSVAIAEVYGVPPTTNGTLPRGFADIDVVEKDGQYSRFAAPRTSLPRQAQEFLGAQRADIEMQMNDPLPNVIFVGTPMSTNVFDSFYWIEHVGWQIAYRNVLIDEVVSLNPVDFDHYGLH